MSWIRYFSRHALPLYSVRDRSRPWTLAVAFSLTLAGSDAISQNPAPADGGSAAAPAAPAETPAKPAPGAPLDLPNRTPGDALDNSELFPELLPYERMTPGLEPIEELKIRAAKRKKAAAPPPEETPVTPVKTDAGGAGEVSRRGVATNRALSTGETLLGGFSNIHSNLSSPFLPSVASRAEPLQFGWGKLRAQAGAGVSASRVSGTQSGGSDESILGFVKAGIEVSAGNRDLAFASSAYQAAAGGHAFASLSYAVGYGFPDSGGNQQGNLGSGQTSGFDQQLALSGNFYFPGLRRFVMGFGLDFASLSGINRDVGAATERNLATASLTASYELSRKTSFDVEVAMPFRDFSDGVSSRGITGTVFGRNWVTRDLRVGVGYTMGKLDVQQGSDQTFNQGLLQVNYQPTRFLQFNGIGGIDFRDSGGSTTATPIFGLGLVWDSLRGTTVSLAAERRIFNAASAVNTNYISTSVALTFGQRLWDRLFASLSLGYEGASYESIGAGGESEKRSDNLFTATLGVTIPVSERLGCSLSCTYGKNESDVSPFTSSQVTFQTSYAF